MQKHIQKYASKSRLELGEEILQLTICDVIETILVTVRNDVLVKHIASDDDSAGNRKRTDVAYVAWWYVLASVIDQGALMARAHARLLREQNTCSHGLSQYHTFAIVRIAGVSGLIWHEMS